MHKKTKMALYKTTESKNITKHTSEKYTYSRKSGEMSGKTPCKKHVICSGRFFAHRKYIRELYFLLFET